jgi:hypothetical protein
VLESTYGFINTYGFYLGCCQRSVFVSYYLKMLLVTKNAST